MGGYELLWVVTGGYGLIRVVRDVQEWLLMVGVVRDDHGVVW